MKPPAKQPIPSRRRFVKALTTGMGAALVTPALPSQASQPLEASAERVDPASSQRAFDLRACFENLTHDLWMPKWHLTVWGSTYLPDNKRFWDKEEWERLFRARAQAGYNGIIYGPLDRLQWQTYLIRHKEFPEARKLPPNVQEPIIRHVQWIFQTAHKHGLKNFLLFDHIATTPAFARAHGMDKLMPESASVSGTHNYNILRSVGPHFVVRNELTRAFTEAAIVEVLQLYPELDGFYGEMGEELPGKRSTWYEEAVVPGMKRSGRKPLYIVLNWQMPREDFVQDIARKNVYDNTWLSVMPNGEMFTDAKPYPNYVKWAEEAGVPTIWGIHMHNFGGGFPHNSPKLAYDMVKEFKKVENSVGFATQMDSTNPNDLFRDGLAYYGTHLDEAYSDERWVAILEQRFGDREAAQHLLNAYNASAQILPEVCAQMWHSTDRFQGPHFGLRYFFFTDQDPRYAGWYTSPSRGTDLIPLRRYAQIVAKFESRHRDNGGQDYTRPPYAQGVIMGPADYQTTPEAQMRKIRRLGEESLREAETALKTVKKNKGEATEIYNYMKAYKLLADYYERKILAAISALIFGFGGPKEEKGEALRLADEAAELGERALTFIWEKIDKKTGNILSGRAFQPLSASPGPASSWKVMTLPDLIAYEKREKEELPTLFKWPSE